MDIPSIKTLKSVKILKLSSLELVVIILSLFMRLTWASSRIHYWSINAHSVCDKLISTKLDLSAYSMDSDQLNL